MTIVVCFIACVLTDYLLFFILSIDALLIFTVHFAAAIMSTSPLLDKENLISSHLILSYLISSLTTDTPDVGCNVLISFFPTIFFQNQLLKSCSHVNWKLITFLSCICLLF